MPVTVGDLMTRSVHTIRPEMRVGQAIHLMTQHGITSLPVVSAHGHLLGMISDSQLLPLVVRPELADDFVGDHMKRDMATTTEEAEIDSLVADLIAKDPSPAGAARRETGRADQPHAFHEVRPQPDAD